MPGFTMHIAVAKEYFYKHRYEIKDKQEFIKGTISPDLDETMKDICKNKNKSHYGKWRIIPVETNIDKFLKDPLVNINNDYWKGYLLHLLTDFYFYNKIFKEECIQVERNNDNLYYDYDCLNRSLIKKYKIDILENIKKYMDSIDGNPKYLNKDKVINFIEQISSLNLEDIIKIIKEKGMEGLQ